MTARTSSKPKTRRTYLYYVCCAGGCPALTHHKAEALEARVWEKVSRILKDPALLRAGLERLIEEENRSAHGDPAADTERWLEEISRVGRKRTRYQEMAAEGLIQFEELRTRLSALEDARGVAEQELRVLRHRTEHQELSERDKDTLLSSYAGSVPEDIDALDPEERHRVYRMIRMEAYLAPDGSFELGGDVIDFSRMVISSS